MIEITNGRQYAYVALLEDKEIAGPTHMARVELAHTGGGAITNVDTITFIPPQHGWGSIAKVALFDGKGNMRFYIPTVFHDGGMVGSKDTISFPPGHLTISEDDMVETILDGYVPSKDEEL